jgi:hypothetical protein
MSKSSRIGQRYPIRNDPVQPISRPTIFRSRTLDLETLPEEDIESNPSTVSDRQLRLAKRTLRKEALQRAQSDPLLIPQMSKTVTDVQRPFSATHQRSIRESAEPEPQQTTSGLPPPVVPRTDPSAPVRPQLLDRNREGNPGDDPGGDPDDNDHPEDPPNPPNPPNPGGQPPDDDPEDPNDPGNPPNDQDSDSDAEISNRELRKALLTLAKGKGKERKKTPFKPREPDTFNGGSPQLLRTFIFQCQIYFNAKKDDYTEDEDRIFFAISHLRGAALDYFEPYITEPDLTEEYDFLTDWSTFVQKLTNQFGSYSPEDDDEDAITSIPFPDDGKATKYFIEFAKYEKRIKWDDRALRKVVKDAIPPRITDDLRYSKEDTSTFEGYRKAVLRIDNDYWKKKQDDANKRRMMHTLQNRLSKTVAKTDQKRTFAPPKPNPTPLSSSSSNNYQNRPRPKPNNFKPNSGRTFTPTPIPSSSSLPRNDHLGPDGKLTASERQATHR